MLPYCLAFHVSHRNCGVFLREHEKSSGGHQIRVGVRCSEAEADLTVRNRAHAVNILDGKIDRAAKVF